MRTCRKCGASKPERDFYVRGDGMLMTACKRCHCLATAGKKGHGWREPGEHGCRPLTKADMTPCGRCGLRGHVAGDPERCLVGSAVAGLGAQSWV